MDLWYPPDHQPPLLEWWLPLVRAAAAARRERVPWPIHLEEFHLEGRIDRPPRPSVWVYRHVVSGGELRLDDVGRAYRFTPTPGGRSVGRLTEWRIRAAVHHAGLPRVVEPVWFEEPPAPAPAPIAVPLPFGEPEDQRGPSAAHPTRRARTVRRGHLTLLPGGRQAG